VLWQGLFLSPEKNIPATEPAILFQEVDGSCGVHPRSVLVKKPHVRYAQ